MKLEGLRKRTKSINAGRRKCSLFRRFSDVATVSTIRHSDKSDTSPIPLNLHRKGRTLAVWSTQSALEDGHAFSQKERMATAAAERDKFLIRCSPSLQMMVNVHKCKAERANCKGTYKRQWKHIHSI